MVEARTIQGLSKLKGTAVEGRYIIDDYYIGGELNVSKLKRDIHSILYSCIKHSSLIDALCDLIKADSVDVESVITYNYDNLLEEKLVETGISCHSVYDKTRPLDKHELQVYHVHGCIPRLKEQSSSSIVLGEKEYHDIYADAFNWGNQEQLHALCRNTCIFIGLSMTDPNLRRLLDISVQNGEVDPVHYLFLSHLGVDESQKRVTTRVMRDFGINCIWYGSHEELPGMIESLIPSPTDFK